jgi:hypothetical protein
LSIVNPPDFAAPVRRIVRRLFCGGETVTIFVDDPNHRMPIVVVINIRSRIQTVSGEQPKVEKSDTSDISFELIRWTSAMGEHAPTICISIFFERVAGTASLKFLKNFRAFANWFFPNLRQMIPIAFPDFLAQCV